MCSVYVWHRGRLLSSLVRASSVVAEGNYECPNARKCGKRQEELRSSSCVHEADDANPPQQGSRERPQDDNGMPGAGQGHALVSASSLNRVDRRGAPASMSDQDGSDRCHGWNGQECESAAAGGYGTHDADPPQQGRRKCADERKDSPPVRSRFGRCISVGHFTGPAAPAGWREVRSRQWRSRWQCGP